jgi:DNA repair protein RecO (recombination protein O)
MYLTTAGIVFHQVKFSETSLVVKIYTEASGLRSFIVKGARGPKSRMKSALFQPMSLLDLVVSIREKSELHYIREARSGYIFQQIPFDIRKSSILLFMNELLYKSIREEATNAELFRYISDSIRLLDRSGPHLSAFPLLFAVQLSGYLGFFPQGIYQDENTLFDMQEGSFTRSSLAAANTLMSGKMCRYLNQLIHSGLMDMEKIVIPAAQRHEILENILKYYSLHLPSAKDFKSHLVLHEVLA